MDYSDINRFSVSKSRIKELKNNINAINTILSNEKEDQVILSLQAQTIRDIKECETLLNKMAIAEQKLAKAQKLFKEKFNSLKDSFYDVEDSIDFLLDLSDKESNVFSSNKEDALETFMKRKSDSFYNLLEKFNSDDCF